jgi:ABC-type glycerol-3-phosphate transport system substrate-binding protein
MRKKVLRTIALAMAASLCLVGCGEKEANNDTTPTKAPTQAASSDSSSSSDNSGSEESTPAPTEEAEKELFQKYDLGGVTITLLSHNDLAGKDPNGDVEDYIKAERQAHVDYIQEKYNVKLEFVAPTTDNWDEFDTEVVSAYTSGHPVADVMDAYYQMLDTYVANEILLDMSAAFAESGAFKNTALFNWTGSQWGVSIGMGGEGLYYNKTWIEELGMEYTPAEMFDMGMWDYDSCYEYLKEMKSKMAADEYPIFVAPYYWGLWATHANGGYRKRIRDYHAKDSPSMD